MYMIQYTTLMVISGWLETRPNGVDNVDTEAIVNSFHVQNLILLVSNVFSNTL